MRYVARATPGATGSRSMLDAVTSGNGAGGATESGSAAPNAGTAAHAKMHAKVHAHSIGTSTQRAPRAVSA
jgi:hypothetical protein